MENSDKHREAIHYYYNQGREEARLFNGIGLIEQFRTQELMSRHLPATGKILDIGGGAGVYALWLAAQGYKVDLIDYIPLHIEQALAASANQADAPLHSATVGDARDLKVTNHSYDAVLMLGPLYHLHEQSDRLQALREAHRVLKPDGFLFAAGISRYASFLDGLVKQFVDPGFVELIREDLTTGHHSNPQRVQGYFTTAYFHHPDELKQEVQTAGFVCDTILAIEGPMWGDERIMPIWEDESRRQSLLEFIRLIESEPTLIGASPHVMAIAQKQ